MGIFGGNSSQVQEDAEKLLSDKLGQKVAIKSSDTLGGGCINHASRIETNVGSFFMKWNADSEKGMFLREAECLQELKKASNGQIIVPEVFAAKEIDETPGLLVLEYLEGGNSASSDDGKLGRGLATIHQYSIEKFGFYNDNFCGSTPQDNSWQTDWVSFFRDNRLGYLLDLIQRDRSLPGAELEVYHKLLDKIPELIPMDSKPVLIHGDLWSGNYMFTTNGPALIDPASYYADREMEMGIMTMFGGFSQQFYTAYNEINPLPSDWKERNALYQLYHVLNHYYIFGGGYGRQALRIARSYV